jgi:hypothetical protein
MTLLDKRRNKMSEEQKTQSDPVGSYPQNIYASRAQRRHERRMAKMAAREQHRTARDERRAAHAARPRRDWTFEMRIGEKLYTLAWRWQTLGFETRVTEPDS